MVTNVHQFNAPIPGESWTQPPGAIWQQPPTFAHPADAADFTWNAFTSPKIAPLVKGMLEAGVPATAIAKQTLWQGVAQGHWTPDVALLNHKIVLGQVIATGEIMGAKDYQIAGVDKAFVKQMAAIDAIKNKKTQDITGEQDGPDGTQGDAPLMKGEAPEGLGAELDGPDGTQGLMSPSKPQASIDVTHEPDTNAGLLESK